MLGHWLIIWPQSEKPKQSLPEEDAFKLGTKPIYTLVKSQSLHTLPQKHTLLVNLISFFFCFMTILVDSKMYTYISKGNVLDFVPVASI